MSAIHQLYWTHCTYATSVFQRRQGERSSDVLGYSVRASSLGPHELRGKFDYIEKRIGLPVYDLPGDTPHEERPSIDPASAPRRLIYHPSPTGLQVLAHLSYRRKDTSKPPRIGSYFGHVLFAEAEGRPWSALDCLQLWGAPWEDTDSPAIDDVALAPLGELADLRRGVEPVIDDALLMSFLTTPQGEPFLSDPRHVIPARWSAIGLEERIDLLAGTLRAALGNFGSNRHVLLMVEPAVAALVFYGVVRLLADQDLRNRMSFSTFEPDPARTRVALAATTFYQPERSELKHESGARSSFFRNTFRDAAAAAPGVASREDDYAQLMLDTLLGSGWDAVDAILKRFQAAEPHGPRELEDLASAQRSAVRILCDGAFPARGPWQQSPPARRLVNSAVRELLCGDRKHAIREEALFESGRHEVLLDLLLSEPRVPENSAAVRFLLERAPEEKLPDLLRMPILDGQWKTRLVVRHIQRTGRLPAGCDMLWQRREPGGSQGPALVPSLVEILARVDPAQLAVLSDTIPAEHRLEFGLALIELAGSRSESGEAVRLAERFLHALPESELCDLLERHRALLAGYVALSRKALGMRLLQLLNLMPLHPEQFDERVELLEPWINAFPDSVEAERRLGAWRTVREILLTLRPSRQGGGRGWFEILTRGSSEPLVPKSLTAGRRLVEATRKAMPATAYEDPGGILRFKCVQDLAVHLLGAEIRFQEQFWWDVRESLANPDMPYGSRPMLAAGSGSKSAKRRRRKSLLERGPYRFLGDHAALVAAGCATLTLVGALLWQLWMGSPETPTGSQPAAVPSSSSTTPSQTPRPKPEAGPAATAPAPPANEAAPRAPDETAAPAVPAEPDSQPEDQPKDPSASSAPREADSAKKSASADPGPSPFSVRNPAVSPNSPDSEAPLPNLKAQPPNPEPQTPNP